MLTLAALVALFATNMGLVFAFASERQRRVAAEVRPSAPSPFPEVLPPSLVKFDTAGVSVAELTDALGEARSLILRAIAEHKTLLAQIESQSQTIATMREGIEEAKEVAQRHLAQAAPAAVLERVTPLVNEARALDVSGHQKRMQVMLNYLRQYPGVPTDVLEAAIEEAVRGGGHVG